MSNEVRARVLSGTLVGAIAVVELRGRGAEALLRELGVGDLPAPGRLRRAALAALDGAAIDDVLVVRRSEEHLELGLHGGVAVREALRAELEARGVRWSDGIDDARSPFVAQIDRLAGELVAARPQLSLLAQRGGALRDELKRIRSVLAREGEAEARRALERLADFSARCAPFLAPRRVALIGPPNAGKSTFFNAVIGRVENSVDARAGSTVDPVMRRVALGDLSIDLWDTAGLDPEATGLAARAAAETLRRVRGSDLVLWLSPRGAAPPTGPWCELVDAELSTCGDLGPPTRASVPAVRAAEDPEGARAILRALLDQRWPLPEGLGSSRACAPDGATTGALRSALAAEGAAALELALAALVNDLGAIEH
ncbi:MAG: 50S ribosome-binding GTPase [Planctomycetes bacterium]|nr:50S ribosome-binding GTPase [Planctomycetota bacterium]